ncbi:MAG: HEAT repeat domain-containing protein [Treponema sp.]|nr:HEAT repeat domain-containing protein [Treponema sp.]
MKFNKIVIAIFCVLLLTNVAFAQNTKRSETTVEQEYLSTIEDVIITELAMADDRDNKQVALQYIEMAIEGGNTSPDILAALDSLAGEGIFSQVRMNGRLENNYPDIRKSACDLLGKVKTPESKETLMKIAIADNEPMVATAAIRSLGEVGLNKQDDVIDAISWTHKKFAALNPSSSLAWEVLIAFEKLESIVDEKGPMIQTISQIAVNNRYVTPVRTKALSLLKTMTGRGSTNDTKKVDAK